MSEKTGVGQELRQRERETADWLKFVWTENLKWFAFFCTLNVTAIGAIHFVDGQYQWYLKLVFFVLNLGAITTSIIVMTYTINCIALLSSLKGTIENNYLDEDMTKSDREYLALYRDSTMFTVLGGWVCLAVVGAMVMFAFIWGTFLFG
jgi:hypothetical protein